MTRGFCIYCGEPGGPVCGRCEYDEHDAVDPITEFRELCERIEREFGEPLSELKRTGTGGFWS